MTESQSSEVLEIELHRLENSCQHLQRSNQELQQAMDLDGPDPDFKQAVEDNIVTLARQQAKIAKLEQEIREAKAAHDLELASTAGTEPQQLTQQAAQTANSMLQQQNLADHVRHSSRPSAEAHGPATAHMHVEPEHNLQRHTTPDFPHPDVHMTDAPSTITQPAPQQCMWL
ncbi:hypothetical protein ABBQ32_010958 [Trebouxia sp. C0010 RCD-2024]